jgi:hypothetical protein
MWVMAYVRRPLVAATSVVFRRPSDGHGNKYLATLVGVLTIGSAVGFNALHELLMSVGLGFCV